jgi:hypothetical protein
MVKSFLRSFPKSAHIAANHFAHGYIYVIITQFHPSRKTGKNKRSSDLQILSANDTYLFKKRRQSEKTAGIFQKAENPPLF